MTNEQLMQPRVLLTGPYPEMERHNLKVGDIIPVSDTGMIADKTQDGKAVFPIDHAIFPNLFRRLEWWEFRDEKDMPEYVRYGDWRQPHTIYRIVQYNPKGYNGLYPCAIAENNRVKDYFLPHFNNSFPATKEEYDNQKQ